MPKQDIYDSGSIKSRTNTMVSPEEIRVVIIDDDEEDYMIINDYINEIEGKNFIVDWCPTYPAALEKIKSNAYHLYFVDYFLGNKTGLDLLKEARSFNFDRPVILLTGFGSRDIDIKAMESGATDYLIKSELSTEKLDRCIRYALERTSFLIELKARENKYRTLFEGSKDAVFIADPELSFKEANQSTYYLLQPKNGNLAGRTLYDYLDDEVQKARIKDLIRSSGNIDDLEIRLQGEDNEEKNCLLSLYVLQDTDHPTVVHGMIHDITSIKKAQLANFQAEKMAANERLIRMLAHEIRNPLNNILLSIEHLLPTQQDEEQKTFLNIIQRNSLRINQIISELLNLANPAEMVFEKHPLQEIIEESLANAADRINLHKIAVEKKFPPSPMIISADKPKLILAFTNILINAVEAMESNNGKLTLVLNAANDVYSICINDNGKGIPKEYLPRLFDPFFTMKKNGVGLGLTASYSIFQSHKADVHVQSNNEGTSFTINFAKA
ncbi:MAG TPA: ATP-binding protein [Chitinophagaceae bacterium]|nr:ATP-binding protein [Chitinophagaceae bacterium]